MILLPTAFIALRSPLVLAAVPGLALRFISTNSAFWGTDWHYNATVMPIVFIAAIDALARIRAAGTHARSSWPERPRGSWRPAAPGVPGLLGMPRSVATALERHGAAMMLAVCAALAFQFPLSNLWQPQTYHLGPHVLAARAAMALVPDGATVETDIDLLAPLAARTDAFWLGNSATWQGSSGNPATKYIVFDRAGADVPPPSGGVLSYVESLNRGARYRLIYENDGVFVFIRS
jgi:hypothetical protein